MAAHLAGAVKDGQSRIDHERIADRYPVIPHAQRGFVGTWLGWRGMFWVAAGITFALLLIIRFSFPLSRPDFAGSYGSLMRSLLTLIREQPVLREAAVINALGFSTFGMFWTTMVLHLSGAPFHFKSDVIGLFGLAAAAGALAAPLVGGSADKRNPRITIGYGLGLLLLSFVLLYTFGRMGLPALSPE